MYIDKGSFFDTITLAFCRKKAKTALLAHRDSLVETRWDKASAHVGLFDPLLQLIAQSLDRVFGFGSEADRILSPCADAFLVEITGGLLIRCFAP